MAETEVGMILKNASRALAEKRSDDAIEMLRGVPGASAEVSTMLGAAYSARRDYDSALRCFQGAVHLEPSARNHFNLAMLHKMRNRPDEARKALAEALKMDPAHEKAKQMLEQLPAPQPAVASDPAPILMAEPADEPAIMTGPPPAPAPKDIFPSAVMDDPLRQSRYPNAAMPPPGDRKPPSYAPSDSSLTMRCARIIGSAGDWWPYIGWMAFLAWFIIPMAYDSAGVFLFLSLALGTWFAIDACDQCVRWYTVAGVLALSFIGTFAPYGGMFLRVGAWVVYWMKVRE